MTDIIKNSVAATYTYTVEEILNGGNPQPFPEARRLMAYLIYKQGNTTTEVAKALKWGERSTVSIAVAKAEFEIANYKIVKKRYNLTIYAMVQQLRNEIEQVETWLKNNPEAEAFLRHDKIRKLASLNEELKDLELTIN